MEEKAHSADIAAGWLPVLAQPLRPLTVPGARFGILATVIAWMAYVLEQAVRLERISPSPALYAEAALYFVTVTMLTLSCLAYLISRLGHFERLRQHNRVPRSVIDHAFSEESPGLTVLVPSYREDERVIRYTLLSAALQEYSGIHVVLLIDDPPAPQDDDARALLAAARELPQRLAGALGGPLQNFRTALREFEARTGSETKIKPMELVRLARHYERACDWFDETSADIAAEDHVDEFFQANVLGRIGEDLRRTASALKDASKDPKAFVSKDRVQQLYSRLVNIFDAKFSSFERKQFASLSHEPNKAMNLNSYIGLMGGAYVQVPSADGPVLIETTPANADLVVADSEYLLTLDADSILLPEYCLRLVYFMEREENARVAVAQTPYTSFRGPESELERIASATTDIQHILHQGLERHNAAFWVGANAVIRKSALMELEHFEDDGGIRVPRYISDRTVIEDTESSLSLRRMDWRIYNYPERLSYSATPPDFGSLVIQRQRWANGGLIIFPELIRLARSSDTTTKAPTLLELFLRGNYLASIGWTSLCLCILFFFPFESGLMSSAAILTAAPYFIAMATDLRRVGYRRRDIFHLYGLNLLLLPINMVGTIESFAQIIGGHKLAFARTPKVQDRTPSPLLFLAIPLVLMVWSLWTLKNDVLLGDWIHFALTSITLVVLAFACVRFIGIKILIADILFNLANFVYVPINASAEEGQGTAEPDWASILYVGSSTEEQRATDVAYSHATSDFLDSQNTGDADSTPNRKTAT